jgi:hypothetical protein
MGMNQLKWYDFLGALILLFSVTKSAIKPPDVVDKGDTLLALSASTVVNIDSLKINPREATLPQIDMLSPSMSNDATREVIEKEIQGERTDGRFTNERDVSGGLTSKVLPKSAPWKETRPSPGSEDALVLSPQAYSLAPAFIC